MTPKGKTWPTLNQIIDPVTRSVLEAVRDAVCTEKVSLSVILKRVRMYCRPRPSDDEINSSISLLEQDKVLLTQGGSLYTVDMDVLEERIEIYNGTP
jgi:hypothetical protein